MEISAQDNIEISKVPTSLAQWETTLAKNGNDPALISLIHTLTQFLEGVSQRPSPGDKEVQDSGNSKGANFQGPSVGEIGNSMTAMALALQELTTEIGKAGQSLSQLNNDALQNMMTQMQDSATFEQQQIQNLQSEQAHQTVWQKVAKAFEVLLSIAIAVISLGTGNVAFAALILVMMVFSESGAFGKMSEGISNFLQDHGVSKEVANLIGSVAVIAATILTTLATCGAGAVLSASTVAETVAEDAGAEAGDALAEKGLNSLPNSLPDDLLSDTKIDNNTFSSKEPTLSPKETYSSSIDNTLSQSVSNIAVENSTASEGVMKRGVNLLKKAFKFIQDYNPCNKLPSWCNYTLLTSTQAIMSTNLIGQILPMCKQMNAQKRQQLEQVLGIVQSLLCAMVSLGAGMALGAGGSLANDTEGFRVKVVQAARISSFAFDAGAAASQGVLASIEGHLANTEALLGNAKGRTAFFQSLTQMINGIIDSNTEHMTTSLAAETQTLPATIHNALAGSAALAQELAS